MENNDNNKVREPEQMQEPEQVQKPEQVQEIKVVLKVFDDDEPLPGPEQDDDDLRTWEDTFMGWFSGILFYGGLAIVLVVVLVLAAVFIHVLSIL